MINPLNLHYAFNSPASIHDEEVLTALELAGRQGAKINEIVKDQNNLRTETENHLKEQDNNIINIRDVTVPADVKAECQRLIASGEFDSAINIYMDSLNERVNTLLGSVTEGSTVMDAEVIDIRTGANGYVYQNAGNTVRAIDKRFKVSNNLIDSLTTENGVFLNKGNLVSNTDYKTTDFIPVEYGKTYYYGQNGARSSMRFVNTFNASRQFVNSYNSYESITIEDEQVEFIRITTPLTNTKEHLNEGALSSVYEPHFINGYEGFQDLEKRVKDINPFVHSRNLIDHTKVTHGYFDSYGGLKPDTLPDSDNSYSVTDFMPVEYGETYYFSFNGESASMRFITYYNDDNVFLEYGNEDKNPCQQITIDNPSCTKVRVTFQTVYKNYSQFEKGSVTSFVQGGLLIPSNRIQGSVENGVSHPFNGKKVAWVGSSITQGYKWCEVVNSYFNFNATNCGVGGTAMCYESVSSMCTKERLKGQYSNVVDPNTGATTYNGVAIPSDVDIIFIEAGTNDWARNWALGDKKLSFNDNGEMSLDTSTFYGACHQFFKNATELFPNAIIIAVGTPYGKMANRDSFTNKYGLLNNQNLQSVEYGDALVEVAGMWGCYGFNFGREMGVHDNNIDALIPDGLHLSTTEVSKKAGNVIINHLLSIKL